MFGDDGFRSKAESQMYDNIQRHKIDDAKEKEIAELKQEIIEIEKVTDYNADQLTEAKRKLFDDNLHIRGIIASLLSDPTNTKEAKAFIQNEKVVSDAKEAEGEEEKVGEGR